MAKAGTLSHLKTKKLKRKLNLRDFEALGIVEALWYHAAASADDGAIGRWTNEEIALAIEWEDDPDKLVEALVDSGFLDHHPTHRLVVHDWHDHAPSYVQKWVNKRVERGKPGFASLDVETPNDAVRPDATSVTMSQGVDESGDSQRQRNPCPDLSQNVAINQGKSIHVHSGQDAKACAETDDVGSPPAAAILVFECDGNSKTWELTHEKMSEWQEAYPSLDVAAECRKAWQWLRDNPTKRKTASGMASFLGRWLAREQNSLQNQGGKANAKTKDGPGQKHDPQARLSVSRF